MTLDGRSLFFPLLAGGESSLTRYFNYRGSQLDSVTLVLPEGRASSDTVVDCWRCRNGDVPGLLISSFG